MDRLASVDSFALSLVEPARLGQFWPWVRAGLVAVEAKCAGVDWTPADVYTALTNGSAYLYVIGQEDGFAIVQRHMGKDGPVLFVWALYGALAAIEDDVLAAIDSVARSIGAAVVRMHSPRKGWQRHGFHVKQYVYEREVA